MKTMTNIEVYIDMIGTSRWSAERLGNNQIRLGDCICAFFNENRFSFDNHPYCDNSVMERVYQNGRPLGFKLTLPGFGWTNEKYQSAQDAIREKPEEFLLDAAWFASNIISRLVEKLDDIGFTIRICISYPGNFMPDGLRTIYDSRKDIIDWRK